jgi:hypothetical protein
MLGPFHATIKLITGEEVLAKVMPSIEDHKDYFVLSNPITISENMQIDAEKGIAVSGMVPKKWMNFASDDLTIVSKTHVISMCELDKFGIDFYKKALMAAKYSSPVKRKVDTNQNSGFVGKVETFRKKLEDTFNDSPDLPST